MQLYVYLLPSSLVYEISTLLPLDETVLIPFGDLKTLVEIPALHISEYVKSELLSFDITGSDMENNIKLIKTRFIPPSSFFT